MQRPRPPCQWTRIAAIHQLLLWEADWGAGGRGGDSVTLPPSVLLTMTGVWFGSHKSEQLWFSPPVVESAQVGLGLVQGLRLTSLTLTSLRPTSVRLTCLRLTSLRPV